MGAGNGPQGGGCYIWSLEMAPGGVLYLGGLQMNHKFQIANTSQASSTATYLTEGVGYTPGLDDRLWGGGEGFGPPPKCRGVWAHLDMYNSPVIKPQERFDLMGQRGNRHVNPKQGILQNCNIPNSRFLFLMVHCDSIRILCILIVDIMVF